jgi:hypothetical protein
VASPQDDPAVWRERSPGRIARVIRRSEATSAGESTPESIARSTGVLAVS